jgi:hypothetical protein
MLNAFLNAYVYELDCVIAYIRESNVNIKAIKNPIEF